MEKKWFNKVTKQTLSDDEYKQLSKEEQGNCVPARQPRGGRGARPRKKKQDYGWYNIDDTISSAVGNFAYNRFTGAPETIDAIINSNSNTDKSAQAQPGIMKIDFIPTMGKSDSAVSALNVAARSTYTWVRHQNSGRTNYEAPDLMIYIGAMAQIYEYFYECERIYAAAMTYLYENRYIGRGLLRACYVDIASITGNLASFRYKLNLLAAKISSLCVPAKFTLFKRHAFIARNVFTDSDSVRGQMYIYRAKASLKFSATAETTGGSLQQVLTPGEKGNSAGWNAIISHLEGLVDAVLQDEDMNIMSGDILKAYGRENCYTLEFIDENITINPVFNEDVLQQIENAFTYRGAEFELSTTNTYRVTQTAGSSEKDSYLMTIEPSPAATVYSGTEVYFNSHKDHPTYENNIEWSRDNCVSSYDSEFVVGFTIYTNAFNSNYPGIDGLKEGEVGFNSAYLTTGADIDTFIQMLELWEKFDWAPMIYLFTGNTTNSSFHGVLADLKVYTIISRDTLSQIHDASAEGLLGKLTMSAT